MFPNDSGKRGLIPGRVIPKTQKMVLDTSLIYGGAQGVIVIVVGNGHGETSSNPGRDVLHFT